MDDPLQRESDSQFHSMAAEVQSAREHITALHRALLKGMYLMIRKETKRGMQEVSSA